MTSIPFIPETSPLTTEQRAWINGYMAGMLSRRALPVLDGVTTTVASKEPLLIMFGTQTGTAEGVAKRLAKSATERGFAPRVVDMNSFASVDLAKEPRLLIVTSTYGDGEMPDNAQVFWNFLNQENVARLEQLSYSVLALGDTNYAEFCAAGKKFDARLESLGAHRVQARVDCDVDYEATFVAWMDGALAALSGNKAAALPTVSAPEKAGPAVAEVGTKKNPFSARLVTRRLLNQPGSEKEVYHYEISLAGSGLRYEVGDALGVMPTNCPALVQEMVQHFGCDGEEGVPGVHETETSFRSALTFQYDITKIPKAFLDRMAEITGNLDLQELLSPEKAVDLKKWLWGREIIDLLFLDEKKTLQPKEFIKLLRPLQARLYSISSSPKAHPEQVHLTVSSVRYHSFNRPRKGVCSTFLADLVELEKTSVPVYTQASHGFRLPTDLTKPVIMVGPGTGIAPFRAFLEERQATGASGKNWLFFGEQRKLFDFYYREELEQMQSNHVLTKLTTAFSRDQKEKIYVQTRLLECAAEVWAWLEEGAYFYVCGDASRMAKDVDAALHAVIEKMGNKNSEEAAAYVAQLKTDKRYLRDVY